MFASPSDTTDSPVRPPAGPGVHVAVVVGIVTIAVVVVAVLMARGILPGPGHVSADAGAASASASAPADGSDGSGEVGSGDDEPGGSDASKSEAGNAADGSGTGSDSGSAAGAAKGGGRHASRQVSHASSPASKAAPEPAPVTGHSVAWIGDSVSAGTTTGVLKQRLPGLVVDAQVGRSSRVLSSEISSLKAKGQLGQILVVELGANGVALKSDVDAALEVLGPQRQLILVTPHGGADNAATTRVYTDTVKRLPKRVQLADWDAQTHRVKDFAPDGIHIGRQGAGVLAETVAPKIAEAKARLK